MSDRFVTLESMRFAGLAGSFMTVTVLCHQSFGYAQVHGSPALFAKVFVMLWWRTAVCLFLDGCYFHHKEIQTVGYEGSICVEFDITAAIIPYNQEKRLFHHHGSYTSNFKFEV